MVGEGVLHECLQSDLVEQVLVVGRKPCGITNYKLHEVLHNDFMDVSAIGSAFRGYNACFFCLGVTSVGKKEDEYTRLTYDLTLGFARVVAANTDGLTFCYVSGAGTSNVPGKGSMWARVKGRTEADLLQLPFRKAYMFRPGYLHPTPGLQHTHSFYKYIKWLYAIIKPVAPGIGTTLRELGLAMINAVDKGYDKERIEVKDILILARS
jgi:hypothetical protein